MSHTSRIKHTIAVVVMLCYTLSATGCYSWEPVSTPTPRSANIASEQVHRVNARGGYNYSLKGLFLRNDSLFGTRTDSIGMAPVGVPVAAIQSITTRQFSASGTIGLLASVGVVLLGASTAVTDLGP